MSFYQPWPTFGPSLTLTATLGVREKEKPRGERRETEKKQWESEEGKSDLEYFRPTGR